MADITMPQLGETVTEGTITRWMKQVGDPIAEDDVLFEVSTDKVDSEVPSPASGFLAEILVQEGETVDVGTRLAVITADAPAAGTGTAQADGGDRAPAAQDTDGTAPGDGTAPADGTEHEGGAVAGGSAGGSADADEAVPGRAADEAAEQDPGKAIETDATEGQQRGTGPGGDTDAAQADGGAGQPAARPGPRAGGSSPAGAGGTRPADDRPPSGPATTSGKVLSPVVRRLIAEYNLDPERIEGTGAGGRITRADVLSIIDRKGATAANGGVETAARAPGDTATPAAAREAAPPGSAAATAAAPAGPAAEAPAGRAAPAPAAPAPVVPGPAAPAATAPAAPPVTAGERDTVVPFTNIRRRTAEHMVRSKQTSAHTAVVMEVDYSAVDEARARAQARFKEQEGFSLTYLPFISRAAIDAIGEWPSLNSSVGDDELIVHNYVNLGIAVDLNFEGLLVPVIHDADGKRLRAIAREISSLAGRARSKRLTMDDISGGTFTITNAGPFGTLLTIPVINQPQVAILATDGVRKRPVVVELPGDSDAIAIHPVGNLVLSFDHRAFDGAYAAAFMASVKQILETRDWSAEL